jgi:lipoic acid synthetase
MKGRLPVWFKKHFPSPVVMAGMEQLLGNLRLHTICQSAQCPNIGDCFSKHTATFLILGDICTRNCTFCAVNKGIPQPPDADEPAHLAEAVAQLSLNHVVITSVTRDDLPDGGARQFARVISFLKKQSTSLTVEVLVPDFRGSYTALETVVFAHPEVIGHNIETVPRLYPEVRPLADFMSSIELLRRVKEMDAGIVTKSGLMVGLGESQDEIIKAMQDLRIARCDLLTIGQYLSPSVHHHPVVRFLNPEEFAELEEKGKEMGFSGLAAAPLVRSSFQAAELYRTTSINNA